MYQEYIVRHRHRTQGTGYGDYNLSKWRVVDSVYGPQSIAEDEVKAILKRYGADQVKDNIQVEIRTIADKEKPEVWFFVWRSRFTEVESAEEVKRLAYAE